MAGMPAWPPPRSEGLLNFLSTLFSSGGVTLRGFKHFATSPTHPHAGDSAPSGGAKTPPARTRRGKVQILGVPVMGRVFRIRTRIRRFARHHPWASFAIRSYLIFSAAFGGAYGFI